MRDTQRQKLYNSEYPIRKFGRQFNTINECARYISDILETRWLKSRCPYLSFVELKDGRGRKNAGAWDALAIITLPKWARNEIVILHELAHIMVYHIYDKEVPSHGREFAKTLLSLVERFVSKDVAVAFKKSMSENKVKYVVRSAQ